MEKGNLYIEAIPGREKDISLREYEQKLRAKDVAWFGKFYPISSGDNRTSRWKWLANDKTKDVRVVFKPEENGILSVWDFPAEEEQFVIGAVGAIEAENKYSIVTALNSQTLSQSVELAAKKPPDSFAIEIFKLSIWLNAARIGFERSANRHGETLQQLLIAGNPQHNVIGCGPLLHLDQSLDTVIGGFINKYGFELKEGNKISIFDYLKAATEEKRIKLNSEQLRNELKVAISLKEGDKADWSSRVYAMAICHETARLNPYRKPKSGQEFAKSEYDPLTENKEDCLG